MGDTGFLRFPTSLDPWAEEFRPLNPYPHNNQMPLLHPHIYFPYPPPYQLPPPPEIQLMPFSAGGVGFPHFVTPPPTPSLPPPSRTPTRALLLSSVPVYVSESEVRRELEVFGDVRAVQMERLRDGIVTVHFYDLRHAQAAATEILRQHMHYQTLLRNHFHPPSTTARGLISGHAVWAQFTVPVVSGVPSGRNQGTLVIFNLDSDVSTSCLREIFQAFGAVKELRETPFKRHQRFVEFYDIRDAAKAFAEMNGKEIHGKQVVIEFSRPGGNCNRLIKASQTTSTSTSSSTIPVPNYSPKLRKSNTIICKGNNIGDNVEASMASLCLSDGIFKKNSKKNTSTASQQQQQHRRQRSFKGRRQQDNKDLDYNYRFLIKEDAIMESGFGDSRTTVMIKNIPNKYSQKLLLNMLDNHCINCNEQIVDGDGDDRPLSSYDFVYLPIDFINKCNVGYGFVNMTSPQATWRLYKAFHSQNWEVFNSKKVCQVTYARLQGLEALKEHFKNSKFPCEAEEYLPVVFSPPRDGSQLTEPTPIVGRTNTPYNNSLHSDACSFRNSDEIGRGGDINNVNSNIIICHSDEKEDGSSCSNCGGGGGGVGNCDGDDDNKPAERKKLK